MPGAGATNLLKTKKMIVGKARFCLLRIKRAFFIFWSLLLEIKHRALVGHINCI